MKAYYAWAKGASDFCVDVVFARNAREAKKIAYKIGGEVNLYLENFLDIRVRRCPDLDWWANLAGRIGVWEDFFLDDPCFLRDAFGYIENIPKADSCGCINTSSLHPDQEARKLLDEKWKICPECGFCAECGHAADCKQTGT